MASSFKYINSIKFSTDLMRIDWSHPKYGFGTFEIYKHWETGEFYCDDEYMGRKFVKDIMNDLINNIEFDSGDNESVGKDEIESEIEKPFLYNQYGNKIPVEFGDK